MSSKMKRPPLHEIPLQQAFDSIANGNGALIMTMSVGQWDSVLEDMYESEHAILLELDHTEKPIKAYQRKAS